MARRGRRPLLGATMAVVALCAASLLAVGGPAAADVEPVRYERTPIASWRLNGVGRATEIVGNTLYVGGSFTTVTSPDGTTSVPRANLAAFDLTTGALLPAFRADTNGVVRALATDGTRLFVGGSYTTLNGASRQRLAAVDPTTGAVDTAWTAQVNSNVYALASSGSRLYVGGSFSNVKGGARSRFAVLDGATSTLLTPAPTFDATVTSIAANPAGTAVYVGGSFTRVSGAANAWLVELSPAGVVRPVSWGLAGPPYDVDVDDTGTRLAVAQTGAGNQGSWHDVATGRVLFRQRCDGDSQAVEVIAGSMFTGFHEACDGDTTQRLTSNDTGDGSRDLDLTPTFDRFWGVWALDGTPDQLVIAGDFTNISGVAVSGFAILPKRVVPPTPVTLRGGSTWRYQDGTATVPATWRDPGFDDTAWPSGPAQLGYGDGDEATVLASGSLSSRPITSYYRTTFTATGVPDTLTLRLLADDGAVVYLNGTEVVRDNLPAGTITSATRASVGRSGTDEQTLRTFTLPPGLVSVGTNAIAVEVHQDSPTSSDSSFLASLSSTGSTTTTTTTTTVVDTSTTTTTVPDTTTTTAVPDTTTTVPDTTTTAVPDTTTTTAVPDTTTTTAVSDTTTTTLAPTTTTAPPTTTTTTAPPTTTTTLPALPPLRTETFDGADGSAWAGWTSSAVDGVVEQLGGAGRIAFNDVVGAYARTQLTALAPVADTDVTLSYRWTSATATAYFSVVSRGSGGWQSPYRPRNGYGLELNSNSTSITVKRASNGVIANLITVTGAQSRTTAKQWLRLRVVGSTIQFKTWADGQAEPATWAATLTDATVTAPGQLHLSMVRSSSNVGTKAVLIDDLVVRDGTAP